MVVLKMIVMHVRKFGKNTACNDRLAVHCISAGDIQRNGIKGCNIPTSGTMGTSFSEWQSQFGETSTTRLI